MLQDQFQAYHKERFLLLDWARGSLSVNTESSLVAYTWLQEASRMRALVSLSVVFFSLPLRFARAWHSVTVSKRREGGRHSIHRRESGLIRRCLVATTSKGKICFACTFACGGRISLFVWRLDLHFSSFKNDVSQTKRGSSSKNELGWPASLFYEDWLPFKVVYTHLLLRVRRIPSFFRVQKLWTAVSLRSDSLTMLSESPWRPSLVYAFWLLSEVWGRFRLFLLCFRSLDPPFTLAWLQVQINPFFYSAFLSSFLQTFWYVLSPNYRSDPPDEKLNSALLLSRRTYPKRDFSNFFRLRWGKSTKARQIDRLLSLF